MVSVDRTIFFRLHLGGYWGSDGLYNGGITRSIRLDCQEPTLAMLKRMVLRAGYAENMCKFAYFPSRIMGQNRKDVSTDSDVIEMIQCSQEIESLNLYVVREDDPYLDDVLIGDDVEEEPEDDAHIDFYQNDYVDSDDSDDDDEGSVIEFFVGQEFVSKEKCRGTIEKYAVREKVNIHFQKSEKKRVAAICAQECCKWRLFASINSQSDKMVVRSYKGEHNCYPIGVVDLYTAPKIAADFLNEFRHNPKLTADQIMQRLGIKGLRVTKTKCQSARQIMKHIIEDEYAEQFTRMYDYVEELRRTNPGSTVILGTKDRVFDKFYTCFQSQKQGWKSACRRIVHLDGTFLKGRMKGQLLTAVGRDPNESMYIIAWAIVPVENKVNWKWFMELLREDLGLEDGNGLALSSDQQKGLIYAITEILPYAEHRMCARHIFANLQKKYKQMGPLHKTFWKCARAYNETVFWRQLEKMKNIKLEAYEDVKRTTDSHWSRAFFSDTTKSAAVENNISESYNAVLKDAREMPIIALLEEIRRHIMASNLVKIKEMESVTSLVTPKALAIMEKRKRSLKWCAPLSNGRGIYEVDYGKDKFVVHVRDNTSCTCREYEVSGIPCCHIMAAMWAEYKETKLPETVILDWYSVEKWKLCYSSLLFPVNGMELWETHSDIVVMPPPDRIMPGRPKNNNRIRDPSEEASQNSNKALTVINLLPYIFYQLSTSDESFLMQTCSNCGEKGHNIRTCPKEVVPKPPKPPQEFPSFHANAVMVSVSFFSYYLLWFESELIFFFADM